MDSILPESSDSKSDPHRIVVTEEFFNYLLAELERPAKPPNPRMVELFRSTRGHIKHIGGDV